MEEKRLMNDELVVLRERMESEESAKDKIIGKLRK